MRLRGTRCLCYHNNKKRVSTVSTFSFLIVLLVFVHLHLWHFAETLIQSNLKEVKGHHLYIIYLYIYQVLNQLLLFQIYPKCKIEGFYMSLLKQIYNGISRP